MNTEITGPRGCEPCSVLSESYSMEWEEGKWMMNWKNLEVKKRLLIEILSWILQGTVKNN